MEIYSGPARRNGIINSILSSISAVTSDSGAQAAVKPLQDFRVLPKHVGVWQGQWLRMTASGQEIARFTATLTKRIVDNEWRQSNAYQYADGTTATHHYIGRPIADGVVELFAEDETFSKFQLIAEEHDESLLLFKVIDRASSALIGLETINLVHPDYCVRTTQGFDPAGTLQNLMVITERRIAP